MYVIIVGGGKVGASLVEALVDMGHEVLVVERDERRCAVLQEKLGTAIMRGDGCEAAVLAEAGAERADVLMAVTAEDEDNLVACQVAQHRFHVRHVIARLNIPKNQKLFKLLGIEATVDAVNVLVEAVLCAMPGQHCTRLSTYRAGAFCLLSVRVPEGAAVVGQRMMDVGLPKGAHVALVVRRDRAPLPPAGDVVVEPDDEILALVRPEDEKALVQALTGKS